MSQISLEHMFQKTYKPQFSKSKVIFHTQNAAYGNKRDILESTYFKKEQKKVLPHKII